MVMGGESLGEVEMEIDDQQFEITAAKRITDKQNYLLSWLIASPAQMRCSGVDADKRFETVLSVLHKERSRKVIPFKPRPR